MSKAREQKVADARTLIEMMQGLLLACEEDPRISPFPFKPSFYKDVLFYMEQLNEIWSPINYAEADSGKGCFDGKDYIFKLESGGLLTGHLETRQIGGQIRVYFENDSRHLPTLLNSDKKCSSIKTYATHYRPIPGGWMRDKEAQGD